MFGSGPNFSQHEGIAIGLYLALAGETIGILEDWRRSVLAIIGFLALMGITYGLIWGWATVSGWVGSALIMLVFVLIYILLYLRQLNARAESQKLLAELQEAHEQLAPDVEVDRLATAELHRDLDAVALLEEVPRAPELDLEVVLLDLRPELDLLAPVDGLLLPATALLLVELELAEVHELAGRRVRGSGHLDQIEPTFFGQGEDSVQNL